MRKLSRTFRSTKIPNRLPSKSLIPNNTVKSAITGPSSSSSSSALDSNCHKGRRRRRHPQSQLRSRWSVYLIISSQLPKTYVGVTTNFARRLKQHNGELRGGAKASSSGRPWTLACIIRGFKNRSEVSIIKKELIQFPILSRGCSGLRANCVVLHPQPVLLNQNGRALPGKCHGKRRKNAPQIPCCSTGKKL